MKQITITRDEFRERIVKNKRGFGMVRAMCEDSECIKNRKELLLIEEIAQIITLTQIEEELFGKEEENGNAETD